MENKQRLPLEQIAELLNTLKNRLEKHPNRQPGVFGVLCGFKNI
jgi:hypothetical protein